MYEVKKTVSKYITVHNSTTGRNFLVRFSNHAPNYKREKNGDCDFFVGRTHLGVTNTANALFATKTFLRDPSAPLPRVTITEYKNCGEILLMGKNGIQVLKVPEDDDIKEEDLPCN